MPTFSATIIIFKLYNCSYFLSDNEDKLNIQTKSLKKTLCKSGVNFRHKEKIYVS